MPEVGAFRQVDEKHVTSEVDLMVWSPKFDLVALSNGQREVVLHRLSWQKVWSLPPHSEDAKVKAMSWRPDGKVLAVGYTTGVVCLCYIENAEVLHTLEVHSEVTCLAWISQSVPADKPWSCDPYMEDNTEMYLPKLQPLTKSYGSLSSKGASEEIVEDKKKLKGQKELNFLLVGSKSNQLLLYTYGVFPVAKVTIGEQGGSEPSAVISAILSEDLNSLVVFVQLGKEDLGELEFSLVTFDTTLLVSHDKEIQLLAQKYGQIATLIEYLQSTIQQMQEAWEDILLEMDSKLYHFAEQKQASGEGTVSNDFLELLLFGTPSIELETFLLKELTDKGLKKLGHSIETSYSNIQKLVVKHLQMVSQAILYHLSEVRGMARCLQKFGELGVDEKSLNQAVMSGGSFVLKTSELQQVIDGSIKNFKAFFRWLYVGLVQVLDAGRKMNFKVIIRLSEEKPPPEFSKITQHDVNFVADFLRDSFTQFSPKEEEESIADLRAVSPTDKKPGFKMEKVGQYLKKENLSYPPDISGNPWIQFCRASHSLKDSSILYPVENNKSLVQLQESLENTTYSALHKSSATIGESMNTLSAMFLFSSPSREDGDRVFIPKVTQFTAGSPSAVYTVFTTDVSPCDIMYIMVQPTNSQCLMGNVKITSVKFTSLNRQDANTSQGSGSSYGRCENHKIVDIAYYDEKLLSVLLVEDTEDQVPVLLQLPLHLLSQESFITMTATAGVTMATDIPVISVGSMIEAGQYRRLENMRAHSFAVSGTRHTATVLFSSRRRVRIFLMDAEEEDEEEDEDEAEISNQSEADQSGASLHDISQSGQSSQGNNQSEMSMQVDNEDGEEGQEDKENSSILSGGSTS